jgi:hypothetical protein
VGTKSTHRTTPERVDDRQQNGRADISRMKKRM